MDVNGIMVYEKDETCGLGLGQQPGQAGAQKTVSNVDPQMPLVPCIPGHAKLGPQTTNDHGDFQLC